ncbi:MAG TPA: nitrogenase iron protein, partial [Verrucomicrobiae bacterium]|nr:nitrogenase iron protein [Verrucomicrobiae bacterium]
RAGVCSFVPRSSLVLQSDLYGKTVIETSPEANHSYLCRRLARRILERKTGTLPAALDAAALREWARGWGDRVRELEGGFLEGGAGI